MCLFIGALRVLQKARKKENVVEGTAPEFPGIWLSALQSLCIGAWAGGDFGKPSVRFNSTLYRGAGAFEKFPLFVTGRCWLCSVVANKHLGDTSRGGWEFKIYEIEFTTHTKSMFKIFQHGFWLLVCDAHGGMTTFEEIEQRVLWVCFAERERTFLSCEEYLSDDLSLREKNIEARSRTNSKTPKRHSVYVFVHCDGFKMTGYTKKIKIFTKKSTFWSNVLSRKLKAKPHSGIDLAVKSFSLGICVRKLILVNALPDK